MSDNEFAALQRELSTAPGLFSRRRLLGTTTLAVAGAALATEHKASAQQPQSVRAGERNDARKAASHFIRSSWA